MAATGSLNLSGTVYGLLTGNKNIVVPVIASSAAVGQITSINLNTGANTITIPTGATAAVIYPPSTNIYSLTLKGVTGDTGIPINRTMWSVLSLDPTATTFVLTAGGAISGVEISFI